MKTPIRERTPTVIRATGSLTCLFFDEPSDSGIVTWIPDPTVVDNDCRRTIDPELLCEEGIRGHGLGVSITLEATLELALVEPVLTRVHLDIPRSFARM